MDVPVDKNVDSRVDRILNSHASAGKHGFRVRHVAAPVI